VPKKRTPAQVFNKIPAVVHGVIDLSFHDSVPLSDAILPLAALCRDAGPDAAARLYLLQDSVHLQPNFCPLKPFRG